MSKTVIEPSSEVILTSRLRPNTAYESVTSPRFFLASKSIPILNKCQIHTDNELSYFCEDCNSGPYCPECIIRGLHRDHKVIPLKNIIELIKSRINIQIMDCNKVISFLEDNSERVENEKGLLYSEGIRIKTEIKNDIMDLERIISQKQEVLNQHIDKIVQTYTTQYNIIIEQLRGEKSRLTQYRKELQIGRAHV